MEQPCLINYPQISMNLQETALCYSLLQKLSVLGSC